jgi:hypothetical protein
MKEDEMRMKNSFDGMAFRMFLGAVLTAGVLRPVQAGATASTQIWNPSTDVQKTGTVHFGIDNYFSIADNGRNPYMILPDAGVTVGILKYLEFGFDLIEPSADPLYFNLKLGLPESGARPALAVGAFNFGTKKDVTDYNMVYGLAAKTLPTIGRISLGYYAGLNGDLYLDENGEKEAGGIIATWDRTLTEKIWASVDYASGKSWYGSLSFGCSYAFSTNVSVIFGYVLFNNDKVVPNNTFTTQLDINI